MDSKESLLNRSLFQIIENNGSKYIFSSIDGSLQPIVFPTSNLEPGEVGGLGKIEKHDTFQDIPSITLKIERFQWERDKRKKITIIVLVTLASIIGPIILSYFIQENIKINNRISELSESEALTKQLRLLVDDLKTKICGCGFIGDVLTITGPRGRDGTRILNGEITPSNELGFVGDYYLEMPNNVLWGPKTDVWSSFIRIKGSTGPQGVKGEKGDKGDKGDLGPIGLMGPTGLQGSQGIKGEKGDKGDTGIKGEQGVSGPQGVQGIPGPKGDKGDMGFTGSTGPQGNQGPKGKTGDTGCYDVSNIDCDLYHDPHSGVCLNISKGDKWFCIEESHLIDIDGWKVLGNNIRHINGIGYNVTEGYSNYLSACVRNTYVEEWDTFKFSTFPMITPDILNKINEDNLLFIGSKLLNWVAKYTFR
jgi:hypothetical protein